MALTGSPYWGIVWSMKKSSLKTFLKGGNPYSGAIGRLVGTFVLDDLRVLSTPNDITYENQVQSIVGFERAWYCDVLEDGTAITYYPGD